MSLYGNYRTRTFTQIFPDEATFNNEWLYCGLYQSGLITPTSISQIYYLLYAKYGNSAIASSDETQFMYKVFSIIYQYGPTWEKRLGIQSIIRGLSESELVQGTKAINNHAYNPSTDPSVDSDNELNYINDQNVTKYKKSKLEAYATVMNLLKDDYTAEFINRFKKLFLTIVEPELPLWYVTDNNGSEEETDD